MASYGLRAVAALILLSSAWADMFDLIEGRLASPAVCGAGGCAEWASLNATIQSWWAHGEVPSEAGNKCAQLPYAPGLSKPSPVLDPTGVGANGAWCVCKDATQWGYCTSREQVPEQVNLQAAASDTVVVSFVTFEAVVPAVAPYATIKPAGAEEAATEMRGVTHVYETHAKDRIYYFHFVKFGGLAASVKYEYAVKSGGDGAPWSSTYTFTSLPPPDVPTSVAIFGDMGVYSWTNMGNMLAQAEQGDISAVVHIGDHCYNMGGADERRGDGYMQAYEPVLTKVPWVPVVGNHEFYDGDRLARYLNQTEGSVVGNPASVEHAWVKGAASTATSALGFQLSAGNHHAGGVHGTTPSGTSRYYSVDIGLIHFVALDMNMYNGNDDCGETCREAQLAWLEADLKAAQRNRAKTPWIVAMSHYPLYCSNCPAPGVEPGAWWDAEVCEYVGHDENCKLADAEQKPKRAAAGPTAKDMVPDFEPLFMKYGVDVYASGHVHDYEYIYPVYNNTAVQKSFVDMKAPVHLVTGNGGPPVASAFSTIQPWSYLHSTAYSYTQMVAHNATTMSWIQIANKDSRVLDTLVLKTASHGPFPIPSTP